MQYFFNLFNSEKVENFIYEENKNIKTNLNFFNVKFYLEDLTDLEISDCELIIEKENEGKYNFNNFKGLGHSNGGLIYTAFIENYLSDYDVKINSLMTIGTPYNFTETNIKNKSVMLADFIAAKENIPTTLHVYSVAGTITYDSDELVPDASVSAGKYIYQNQAKSYTEITVTGEDAQHSDLPTNDEVVELIKQHIEGQGVRKKQKTNLEPQ